jgi:hypothetical protein
MGTQVARLQGVAVTNSNIRYTGLAFGDRRGPLGMITMAQFRYTNGAHVCVQIHMVEEKHTNA